MKRKLITLALLLLLPFSFAFKVEADELEPINASNTLLYSTYYAIIINYEVPEGTIYVDITIPAFTGLVLTQTGSGVKSYLQFDAEDFTSPVLYEFEDIGGKLFGRFRFILNEYSATGARKFTIVLMHNYGVSLPSGYLASLMAGITYKVDDVIYNVKYYSQGVLYDTDIFIDTPLPVTDPTPPTNYEFEYWALSNGTPYEYTIVTADMVVNDTFYLYARFTPIVSGVDVDEPTGNVPSGLTSILGLVNLDNTFGYNVFYVFIGLLLIVVLVWKFQAPILIVTFVEIAWLGISMFMGIVNIWAIVLVLLLAFAIIKVFWGNSNEY